LCVSWVFLLTPANLKRTTGLLLHGAADLALMLQTLGVGDPRRTIMAERYRRPQAAP